jgi:hypothetical protein
LQQREPIGIGQVWPEGRDNADPQADYLPHGFQQAGIARKGLERARRWTALAECAADVKEHNIDVPVARYGIPSSSGPSGL